MTVKTLLAFVALCSVLFLLPSTQAATYVLYLDATVASDGDGSSGSPFKNADTAFAFLQPKMIDGNYDNYTLYVAAGDYTTTSLSVSAVAGPNKILTIIGTSSPSPSFSCASLGYTFITLARNTGTFAFNVKNIRVHSCWAAFDLQGHSSVTMDEVTVDTMGGGGLVGPVSITSNLIPAYVSITNSKFLSNSAGAGLAVLTVAPAQSSSSYALIQDCTFDGNDLPAFKTVVNVAVDTLISDCVFTNNLQSGAGTSVFQLQLALGNYEVTFENILVLKNSVADIFSTSSSNPGLIVNITSTTEIRDNQNSNSLINAQGGGGNEQVFIDVRAIITQNDIDAFYCTGASVQDFLGHDLCNISCTATSFDLCFVCGGSSVCLGCDGIPYSTTPCNQTYTSGQSSSNATNASTNAVAVWTDNIPNPVLKPLTGASQFVNITLGVVEERTTGGVVVKSLDLSKRPWVMSVPKQTNPDRYERVWRFFATDGSKMVIKVTQTLFRVGSSVNSGGVTYSVDPNTLKFAFEITNWKFASPTNVLAFFMSFDTNEGRLTESTSSVTINGYQISTVAVTTLSTKLSVNLQHWAIFDSTTRSIDVNLASSTTTSSTYEFVLPYQFTVMDYDPDFGVVLAPSSEGDNSDSSDNSGLIIGLTVGLVGAALLVVMVIIVGAVVFTWWKVQRHRYVSRMRGSSMVNFENDINGETSSSSD